MSVEFWMLVANFIAVFIVGVYLMFRIEGYHDLTRKLLQYDILQVKKDSREWWKESTDSVDKNYLSLYDEVDSLKIILDGIETNVQELIDAKDAEAYEKIISFNEPNEKEDLDNELETE